MKLRDKVVVITVSGGGTGVACGHRCAIEEAKGIVTEINSDGVQAVAGEIGRRAAGALQK